MTDSTVINSKDLGLVNDITVAINNTWGYIRQFCHAATFVGSHVTTLQPLYNRLYALDSTLPAILPQEGTLDVFKKAFEKIQAQQQLEIAYLKEHHPERMAQSEPVFQGNTAASIQSLEAINAELDNINSDIIRKKIDLTSSLLDLTGVGITRLPVSLFQDSTCIDFWKTLSNLSCSNNHITVLDVRALTALHTLNCCNNLLTSLKVQGIILLEFLFCNQNQITILNLEGLAMLQKLSCDNNPLKILILKGVNTLIKLKHAELQKKLLLNELSQTKSSERRKTIISKLGTDYTPDNCFTSYCAHYAEKLFTSESVNNLYCFASSTLSQASTFLPSFAFESDIKRMGDDSKIHTEEPTHQPELKKRKKK